MSGFIAKMFKQEGDSPRLFQSVGKFLVNRDVIKTLGGQIITKDGFYWSVLFGENSVLGFAVLEQDEEIGHLKYLYINPEEEKITGYRALIKELVDKLETLDSLWTVDHIERKEMWEKLGFKKAKQKSGNWYYFERKIK